MIGVVCHVQCLTRGTSFLKSGKGEVPPLGEKRFGGRASSLTDLSRRCAVIKLAGPKFRGRVAEVLSDPDVPVLECPAK